MASQFDIALVPMQVVRHTALHGTSPGHVATSKPT